MLPPARLAMQLIYQSGKVSILGARDISEVRKEDPSLMVRDKA